VLVPVETSIMALDGLKILLTTLEDINEGFGHQVVLAGVVACRFDIRTRLSRLVLDELCRALPDKVFKTVIRENVRMRECPASGQSILEFAPDSHAAQDYLALAKEMLAYPDAWQQPARWATEDAGEIDGQTQRCSVDNLRSRAAATIRAGAATTSQPKPLAPVETPDAAEVTPPVERAESGQAGQADATHAAINRWTGGPVPNRAVEAHEPPVEPPAAAMALEYRPGPPPDHAGLDSCIDRLAQAEDRLSIPDVQVEADELPTEPEPTAAAQGFEPAPVGPAQAAIGATWNAPPPGPQEPDKPEEPEEPEEPDQPQESQEPDQSEEPKAGDKAFPALRAFLRQMGHADELAEVASTGSDDATDSP